jgi:hypothetical protein
MTYPGPVPWIKEAVKNKPSREYPVRNHTWETVTATSTDKPMLYVCRNCGGYVYPRELDNLGISPLERNLDLVFSLVGRNPDLGKEEACPRL